MHVAISIPNHMTYHAKRKHLFRQNKKSINHNKIINYSNRPLSKQETSPRISFVQSKSFLDSFINRMSTKYHFKGEPFAPHPFHKPSGWTLPPPKNDNFNQFFSNIKQEIKLFLNTPITERNHIPSQLINALHQLQNDQNIIIKPADKGGATVVLNKQDYNDKVLHILSDKTFYRQMTHNLTTSILHKVQSLIEHLHIKGIIDDKTHTFLSPKNPPRTPLFYGLPKVHKPNWPLRPIVSANDSPTENISSYVNHFLQPYMKAHQSFTKDTGHFLSDTLYLPNLPEGACLVTADVVSMYNNFPHREGIETIIQHIKINMALLPENCPQPGTIQSFLDIILANNRFQYDDMFFQQIMGTAMGTICAPPYASIFMHKIENQILNHAPHSILFWRRFIDDCFLIFTHGEDKLLEVLAFMNVMHPTIKYTFKYS